MGETGTAKLFRHGRSQAVRLPKDFRMTGTEVRIRRFGRGILLEPVERDVRDIQAVFTEIDRLGGAAFLPEGRPAQPAMPAGDDISFDLATIDSVPAHSVTADSAPADSAPADPIPADPTSADRPRVG